MPVSDPDPIPLLHWTRRRHEPQLPSQHGGILETVVGLDQRKDAVRKGDEHSADLSILSVDDSRTHLSG